MKKKLIGALDAAQYDGNLDSRIAERNNQNAKHPLSLYALGEAPRLRLLFITLQQLEKEAGVSLSIYVSFSHLSLLVHSDFDVYWIPCLANVDKLLIKAESSSDAFESISIFIVLRLTKSFMYFQVNCISGGCGDIGRDDRLAEVSRIIQKSTPVIFDTWLEHELSLENRKHNKVCSLLGKFNVCLKP